MFFNKCNHVIEVQKLSFFLCPFYKPILLNRFFAHENESRSSVFNKLISSIRSISVFVVAMTDADEVSPPLLLVANKTMSLNPLVQWTQQYWLFSKLNFQGIFNIALLFWCLLSFFFVLNLWMVLSFNGFALVVNFLAAASYFSASHFSVIFGSILSYLKPLFFCPFLIWISCQTWWVCNNFGSGNEVKRSQTRNLLSVRIRCHCWSKLYKQKFIKYTKINLLNVT